jgi:hypothetical protein
MKTVLLLSGFCLFAFSVFSQSLQGTWDGSYTYYMGNTRLPNPGSDIPLILKFELNVDSSYKITSISDRGQEEVTCAVFCRKSDGDSVILQEMRVIKPAAEKKTFFLMSLKIIRRKKTVYLEGIWAYSSSPTIPRGEISLYKKR